MALKFAADMAYPLADFADLPGNVEAILGYVGEAGVTPHIWTADDVARARAHCGHWWPIWNASLPGFDATEGNRAGSGMVNALPAYGVSHADPVFLDVEHNVWVANPAAALAGIRAWKQTMQKAGYSKAYAYVPAAAGFDWVANWTNTVPKRLGSGVVGIQYGGENHGGAYDLSVFDASLWGEPQTPVTPPVTTDWLDMATIEEVRQVVREEITAAARVLYHGDVDALTHADVAPDKNTHPDALACLGPIIRDIQAKVTPAPSV